MRILNADFSKKGLTLIEVIIALGIFTLLLFILYYFYFNYYQVYNFQQATTKVAGSASQALNELQKNILQADKIVASYTISGDIFSTDQDTLILEIPSIDSFGNILNGKYDYVVFYSNGANFYKKIQADASSARLSELKLLSSVLFGINFIYNNIDLAQADKIDIDITTQATVSHQTVSYHLQEKIYLRNF